MFCESREDKAFKESLPPESPTRIKRIADNVRPGDGAMEAVVPADISELYGVAPRMEPGSDYGRHMKR